MGLMQALSSEVEQLRRRGAGEEGPEGDEGEGEADGQEGHEGHEAQESDEEGNRVEGQMRPVGHEGP